MVVGKSNVNSANSENEFFYGSKREILQSKINKLSSEQKYRIFALVLPVMLFIVSFIIRTLFTTSLYSWDEGWASIIARKMLEDQNWFVPVYFGEGDQYYLFDKPFFVFWFLSISMTVFGFTSFTSKLPMILTGSLLSPLAYFFAKGKNNKPIDIAKGLLAGLFVSFAYFLVLYSRSAYIDSLIVFFGSFAAFCTIKSIDEFFEGNHGYSLAWLSVSCIATTITILCKAWQGLVFLPAIGIYFALKTWKQYNVDHGISSEERITLIRPLTLSKIKYSIPSMFAVILVFSLINPISFFLTFIPAITTLIHSLTRSDRLLQLYESGSDRKVVLMTDLLGKILVTVIPALVMKISLYGLTSAILEVLDLVGISWSIVFFHAFIMMLSSLLLWLPLNWIYEPLEEIILKNVSFLELSVLKSTSRFLLVLLPGLLPLSWGLILFVIKPAMSPLLVTLIFIGMTIALFTFIMLAFHFIKQKKEVKWSFTGKLILFEGLAVVAILLAFTPLLAWIDWIDSINLGLVIRKSGEMAMHPEIPIPEPLTYKWLFFEYYLGWRYNYGTVYTVIDSLGIFLDPQFLIGLPFFFAGLYYMWKSGKSEKGFFFLTWFATVLLVFLPAKFQLNYYYYPAFLPYFCLTAVGIYEMATSAQKLLCSTVVKRALLLVSILLIHFVFLYLPIIKEPSLDLVYLLVSFALITGGSAIITLIGRNLPEIIAGWLSMVAMHWFLIKTDILILVTVVLVVGGIITLFLITIKKTVDNYPVRSLLVVLIIVFTGLIGTSSLISRSQEIDLHSDKIAAYIIPRGGTDNFTCWVAGHSGLSYALRYEVGNPFFAHVEASKPFLWNNTIDFYEYTRFHPKIKFWIFLFEKNGDLEDVRNYSIAWNYFINLEGVKDVSEEAGLPDNSITRIYANQSALETS
ncbi:MAG: ArnT family glycosyltransferase [Candidatus Hodarchaeales archaeon]|jgi:4-amino-4-deoxy-L-arabinose transferase-like glycosyltransferase